MVFFTSILIVAILYYLQADGLIYVTIIAVVAELVNMFMTQTLTKSVEKKSNTKWGKMIEGYKSQVKAKDKTIKELEDIQEESVKKLYNANKKIKNYEEQLGITIDEEIDKSADAPPQEKVPESEKKESEEFIDLPCGSNGIKKRV